MTANNSDRHSRRSYRVTTSRSTSTDNDSKSLSANLRGKTPLIWNKNFLTKKNVLFLFFIYSNTTNYIYKSNIRLIWLELIGMISYVVT
jgi:hypothetical protein